jgi:predicted permease
VIPHHFIYSIFFPFLSFSSPSSGTEKRPFLDPQLLVMFTYLGMAIVGLMVAFVVKEYLKLRRNINIAKASGIPYIITRK